MSPTLSLTQSQIFTALGNFLSGVLPAGVRVIQGQQNQVAEPLADFVEMALLGRRMLATNTESGWIGVANPTTMALLTPMEVAIRLDVHGPLAADNSQLLATTLRSYYAAAVFQASGYDVGPIDCRDPEQVPFIPGERQFENRWMIRVLLQANPVVSIDQQYADVVTPGVQEVN